MKLHVFTQHDELPQLPNNLPYPQTDGCPFTTMKLTIPNLEFGKTYYKLENDNLIAFRIFGMLYCAKRGFYYLVQLPNKELSWICQFINKHSCIFKNQHDMYDYLNGNYECDINNYHLRNERHIVIDDTNGYEIYQNHIILWKQDQSSMRPTKVIANIAKLIILPNDVICQVTLDNDTFFSQLDCVKNILNRMTITSFDDGTLFNINIPNNKQKITKLKVYEYIV
jgi:hypothetical protein